MHALFRVGQCQASFFQRFQSLGQCHLVSGGQEALNRLAGAEQAPVDRYQVALERPLSAEQLLASMLVATGRELDADQLVDASETFAAAFAGVPREPELQFAPSVKAALFLMNDPLVLSWLRPEPGSLVERASSLDDDAVADCVYLAVLSRHPVDEERDAVVELLANAGDARTQTVGHIVWALLASTEFCLNH